MQAPTQAAKPMNKRPLDPQESSDSDDDSSSDEDEEQPVSVPYSPPNNIHPTRAMYHAQPAAPPATPYVPPAAPVSGNNKSQQNNPFVQNNVAKQSQASSIPRATSTPSSNQKKSRRSYGSGEEDDTSFLFSAVNHALQGNQMLSPSMSSTSSPSIHHMQQQFQNMNHPSAAGSEPMWIASPAAMNMFPYQLLPQQQQQPQYQVPQQHQPQMPVQTYIADPTTLTTQAPKPAKQPKKAKQQNLAPPVNSNPAGVAVPGQGPVSSMKIDDRNWSLLVQQSMHHPRFQQDYSFPSEDSSWIRAKSSSDSNKDRPMVLAMDCEMCETTDPVTNERDPNSLIRISLIDGYDASNVVLDVYLLPSLPITDMKTHIHGITEEKLRNGSLGKVATSLRQIQAMILGILSEKTILVGHALYNDFKALHLKHNQIVDTSYLYSLDLASNHTGNGIAYPAPSLREISQYVLNCPLPLIHDAVQDAQTALR
jgi:hypothetical protein